MEIIKELNGLTVGELKTMLEQVPNEIEIGVWGPNVDWAEIQVDVFPNEVPEVFITIETVSPY